MNPQQIEELYDEFHTPLHVRRHCLQVALVGELIATNLAKTGIEIEPSTVWAAGMLHDLVRIVDFSSVPEDLGSPEDQIVWKQLREQYKGLHHAQVGAEILTDIGETELADIIGRHATASLGTPTGPNSWKSKLVFYADKRVSHDEIVSLEERLAEGWKRHFNGRAKSDDDHALLASIFELEKELFAPLSLTPEDVQRLLS
jgi:uncharacterized protein